VGKYRAAVAAKNEIDAEFVICARCDTLGAEGGSFEDTVQRCIAYVKDGGADFVWLNSIESREQVKEACARIPAPVLTIWGGPEPAPTPEEYEKLGLRIVLYPVLAATAGMQAAWQLFNDLKQRGKPAIDDWADSVRASRFGAVQLKTLVNSAKVREIEDNFLPDSAKRDYEGTWGHATPLGEKNL
jgi:2-methylisocitrate lyase-like PEP mutase family enzyme